eukprot:TRINITY_DN63671_c0_g1_i1.p1 TRINITY_DN63671_c0_g1~~TRINITY_DN63671_c0_g1_i1.p1  ORF type:complete len:225 (-),score=26.99 TRINITY_DN63671_c0_g1_i1:98-772(-)
MLLSHALFRLQVVVLFGVCENAPLASIDASKPSSTLATSNQTPPTATTMIMIPMTRDRVQAHCPQEVGECHTDKVCDSVWGKMDKIKSCQDVATVIQDGAGAKHRTAQLEQLAICVEGACTSGGSKSTMTTTSAPSPEVVAIQAHPVTRERMVSACPKSVATCLKDRPCSSSWTCMSHVTDCVAAWTCLVRGVEHGRSMSAISEMFGCLGGVCGSRSFRGDPLA